MKAAERASTAAPTIASVRSWGPAVLLALAALVLILTRGDARPSERDDQVFLQAAYFMKTERVSAIEGVARAAEIQFGWSGDIIERFRTSGEIQTYALLPLWKLAPDLRVGVSPWGRALYVESESLSLLSQLLFIASVFVFYWAASVIGPGIALAAGLLLAFGHPFRLGPTLFDPWVMPFVAGAIGFWLRGSHVAAAGLAVVATMVKPNYIFLLPAFAVAALVAPGSDEPAVDHGRRAAATHLVAAAGVVVAYLLLAWAKVIYAAAYFQGIRAGYDLGVLVYSLLEVIGYRFRPGTLQLRTSWPLYPWTILNAGVLAWLGWQARRTSRLRRVTVLLGLLILVPVLANFTVLDSVHAYEWGGHFRWINVSIIAMALALPIAYAEAARSLSARRRRALVV